MRPVRRGSGTRAARRRPARACRSVPAPRWPAPRAAPRGSAQMYSCSAESGATPRASSASCSWPKSANAQRITSCGFALLAAALAHLLQAVIDQVELERILVDAGRIEPEHAHLAGTGTRRCRWCRGCRRAWRRCCARSPRCASGCRSRSRPASRRRAARSLRRAPRRSCVASWPLARLMAASTLSLGMLTARAFWITRRSAGFEAGSGPPAFTAIAMSLAMRVNCFAIRFQRANIACLRTSKMRPMAGDSAAALAGNYLIVRTGIGALHRSR